LYRVAGKRADEEGGEMPYKRAEIRPYREADEPLLFGLARMTFGDRAGWSDTRTLSVLETEAVFVAEIGGAVAGYVALQPTDPAVRIDVLLVSPEHEGEGIGHQLVEWAEGYAISCGAETLQVAVEEDNARARDFYRRCGFVPLAAQAGLLELVLPRA
jgi:ribosomal protein S18 acetylase RimI-like enzyme